MKKLSLYNKLLLSFFLVGFFPFMIFYIYAIYWAEDKIISKIITEQSSQTQKIIQTIDNHLHTLQNELYFLSKIDIMDDIVAEDIDKRISRFLTQKKEDINLDMNFYVVNEKNNVISSSEFRRTYKKFLYQKELQKALLHNRKYFFIKKKLYMYTKIYASFASNKEIGILVLEYNLDNLRFFFTEEKGAHNTLYEKKENLFIGEKTPFEIDVNKNDYILDKYLVTLEALPHMMSGWYLVYYKDKSVALNFLYDFLYFMLAMIPIIFIFVIIIGILSTKNITNPILYLTKTAEDITQSKNYTQNLVINSQDEIGRLSYAFNELLQETNSALENLKQENRVRLKRFIELIEIFNAITQTKTEEECVSISILKMQEIMPLQDLHFSQSEKRDQESIPVFVTDFELDRKKEYGYIVIGPKMLDDINEYKFYNSIASMISLQLDRIGLINKTLLASKAKSSFISNMSHELRTPLNSIIGSTQYLIGYEDLSDEQQDMVVNIENSAQYLLEMINGILDIAKIEAGKMEVEYKSFDIVTTLESIISMFMPLIEQKDLILNFDVSSVHTRVIKSDSKLFKQIIINLLSNAIKFTHQGSIEIYVTEEAKEYKVIIKDSGIGIDPKHSSKLFDDFVQLRNSDHKEYKGTGLGLSLSKKLANLLDGDIILKSEGIKKGTKVILILKNQS